MGSDFQKKKTMTPQCLCLFEQAANRCHKISLFPSVLFFFTTIIFFFIIVQFNFAHASMHNLKKKKWVARCCLAFVRFSSVGLLIAPLFSSIGMFDRLFMLKSFRRKKTRSFFVFVFLFLFFVFVLTCVKNVSCLHFTFWDIVAPISLK